MCANENIRLEFAWSRPDEMVTVHCAHSGREKVQWRNGNASQSATIHRSFIDDGAAAASGSGLKKKKYKACIIGDSKMGGYGHCIQYAFALRNDVATVALADPDESGRKQHAKEVGVERTYADYREMLEKERPDLVAVAPRCTVNHKDYMLACAEAGAHGFIEKPFCDDLSNGDKMVAAIEAKNLKWAIAFNFRGMPLVQHAKRLVQQGLIGTVLETRGRGKEDRRAGGEDLIVLGAHVLDLMRFFMGGSPIWCTAVITDICLASTAANVRKATEPLGPIVRRSPCMDSNGVVASIPCWSRRQWCFGIDVYGPGNL